MLAFSQDFGVGFFCIILLQKANFSPYNLYLKHSWWDSLCQVTGVEYDLEDNFADSCGVGLLVALHPLAWGPGVQKHFGEMSLQQGMTVAITVPKD